jgi:hypothetical protein
MSTLLSAFSFDQVRAAIDLALDASALPDETIALPLFVDRAEADIVAQDASALTYLPADSRYDRVQRAHIYFTAAYIVPSLPNITQEQVGSDRYTRKEWDAEKQVARLRGLANAELAAYLTTDGLSEPLFAFGRACGRRGF